MSMWEPYTERARRSIVLAQEEAMRMGNNYIGTEHVLLGIIAEGESLAAKYLEAKGLTLRQARFEAESIVGFPANKVVQQEMVFTPRTKRVFELAYQISGDIGDNYLGTEHLLLALVREGEGVACKILTKFGCEPNTMRNDLFKLQAKEVKTQANEPIIVDLSKVPKKPIVTKTQILAAAAAMPMGGTTPRQVAEAMFKAAGFQLED